MLLELRVKDLGIIEDIDWMLDDGLNVITGETGAGKSLVIDAVELLLTGTASDDIIRNGATEARIEGVFDILEDKQSSSLRTFLVEQGLSADENTLVVNCQIRKQKPSIIRINGQTVTKTILRRIGQLLIDIHGQSEHLSLLDTKYHLAFLDAYAVIGQQSRELNQKVAHLQEIESEIKVLRDREKDTQRQKDFLKYQIDEIKRSKLRNGEDGELEKERHTISFSQKLKEYSDQICQSLYESNSPPYATSALSRLNEAVRTMRKLVELDPILGQQLDYLQKTVYGLEEIARDVRSYSNGLEHNPQRLEEIELRLELIHNLQRKYGKTIGEILEYLEKSEKELAGIGLSSERQKQLEEERSSLKKDLGTLASALSRSRSGAAQRLVRDVKKELHDLDMSQMEFEVFITQTQTQEGIEGPDGKTYAFNNEGIDKVDFMVSTNPGEPLKPLAKIASTGEISRFALALKGALSRTDDIPILIFDEIDIGVGGRSGDIIGQKLWTLARNHQVICVTHLPQIAVYADAHFCVLKEASADRTISTLKVLDQNTRLRELAIMLAGPGYTETALKNAAELRKKAETWKKGKSFS